MFSSDSSFPLLQSTESYRVNSWCLWSHFRECRRILTIFSPTEGRRYFALGINSCHLPWWVGGRTFCIYFINSEVVVMGMFGEGMNILLPYKMLQINLNMDCFLSLLLRMNPLWNKKKKPFNIGYGRKILWEWTT